MARAERSCLPAPCAPHTTVPVELRDGDDVLFGEASMVKVHITAAPAPGVATGYSVEQFLTDQCEVLVQRLQVCCGDGIPWQDCAPDTASLRALQSDMEREVNTLRAEADTAIAELQRAAAE